MPPNACEDISSMLRIKILYKKKWVDLWKREISGDSCSWDSFCVPVHIFTVSGNFFSKESAKTLNLSNMLVH